MTRFVVIILAASIAGCTATSPPAQNVPVPPAPPATSAEINNPGARANTIYMHCSGQARMRCTAGGAYCRAYVKRFTEVCMIENGAAPEYVMVLVR